MLENTLILFTGDNGPWMTKGLSAGSTGIYTGRYAGYWNTGKGSTWEGGIHEAAFAYWKGQIAPRTRSNEIVSSLDVFPTVSALAGVPLPKDRVYDGRSMVDVLLNVHGRSLHDVLFFYGGAGHIVHMKHLDPTEPGKVTKFMGPSAARMGCWKAHWSTGPGLGACSTSGGDHEKCPRVLYPIDAPLLFNICIDPSEGIPLAGAHNGTRTGVVVNGSECGTCPPSCRHNYSCPPFNASDPGPTPLPVTDNEISAATAKIVAAVKVEMATFTYGILVAPELLPGEQGGATLNICCDKDPFKPVPANYSCDCDGRPYSGSKLVYSHTRQCV